MTQSKRNRLSGEHSPYLLQHSDNPVAWYPWGSEAFDVAAKEGKPVFLSIGYATCHWCHVMEEESFKDQEVATLLNRDFISVKVDREELPHVDQVYMTAAQLMTQGGGWPLTLFLTPERKPFYAGTYFPKSQIWGKPGLMELLPQIAQLWKDDRPRVYLSANSVQKGLDQVTVLPGEVDVDKKMLHRGASRLLELHDPNYGGFGPAPKFPIPHNLLFLMRYAYRNGDKRVLKVVKATLDGMAGGGIQDQLGGGFHRYSVDEKWEVPHFEKMLYDQALLLMAYSEMAQISGERRYVEVAEGIVSYVAQHLTSPEGAFYSAEDADSDGGEGNFYVWTRDEILSALGQQDGLLFCDLHSVSSEGNFLDPHHPIPGRNVLQRRVDDGSFAEAIQMNPATLRKRMAEWRKQLLTVREGRIRPKRDEKILADWNGLMIAALAGAAWRLKKPQWLAMATRAWDAVGGLLWSDSDGILHRHFHGHSGVPGQLDDHAFMLWAAVELHQATLDEKYLKGAEFLAEAALAWFGDGGKGQGFFMTRKGVEVPTRPQIVWDGAIPSGNSAMMLSLARLARLLGHAEWEARVHGVLRGLSGSIAQTPEGHSLALVAADYLMGPSVEVHLVYKSQPQDVLPFLEALQRQYRPNVAVARHRHMEGGYFFAPTGFSRDCGADSVAIAYACRDFSCEAPVCEPEALEAIVDGSNTAG